MGEWKIYAFADEASPEISGQIAAMQRNGLSGLEIRNADGINVSDLSFKKAKEIRSRLDDAGLTVWSAGSPIGKVDIIEDDCAAHLEKFRHTLEIADILGAKNIRLFSFYYPQQTSPEKVKDKVFAQMAAMLDAAKGTGVDLCHENEKGIFGDMACRCLELHQAFPALKAVFDPANFIQCGQDTWEAWEMLKPYVKYVHIKDALADGNVVPAGKGIGQVPRIIREYFAMGGRSLTLEPHLKVFDGLAALERAYEKSAVGAFCYNTNDEAFDAACAALREILREG